MNILKVTIAFMALLILCAPCMAACSGYSDNAKHTDGRVLDSRGGHDTNKYDHHAPAKRYTPRHNPVIRPTENPEVTPTEEPEVIPTGNAVFTTVNPREGNTWWVGADGKKIALVNNNQAGNPTYAELVAFIKVDPTDKARYTNSYQCGDFAETFNNNAEKAGIKTAWVALEGINHACNAVQTSDRGMIFVDCTGTPSGGSCYDTTVSVSVGQPYKRVSLFCSGSSFGSMGTVSSYQLYW